MLPRFAPDDVAAASRLTDDDAGTDLPLHLEELAP